MTEEQKAGEKQKEEAVVELEKRHEDELAERDLQIEDLQQEVEKLEAAAQIKEQENSLAGRMSDIVNQARYKRELDELKEKVKIQTA